MKYFAANWKLHKNPSATREFLTGLKGLKLANDARRLIVFPPATSLESTAEVLKGSDVQWGAQNAFSEAKGAFTGEISADVLKELGAQWVLVGHSERRKLFLETDEMLAKKVQYVQSLGLTPMLCIGETLEEREAGQMVHVVKTQLDLGLALAKRSLPIAIAYEPVWAIGTGKVATASQVAEAHEIVHRLVAAQGFAATTPILYGGSVKPDNAKELIQIRQVDGFLIGGASLELPSFVEICKAV